jgi:hypothetical protein
MSADQAATLYVIAEQAHQEYEKCDPDTLEAMRFKIAWESAAKAADALSGKRDTIIINSMKRPHENLENFSKWCQRTRKEQAAYVPERDYAILLRETYTNVSSASNIETSDDTIYYQGLSVSEDDREILCPQCGHAAGYLRRELAADEADPRRHDDGRYLLSPFDFFICTQGHITKIHRTTYD